MKRIILPLILVILASGAAVADSPSNASLPQDFVNEMMPFIPVPGTSNESCNITGPQPMVITGSLNPQASGQGDGIITSAIAKLTETFSGILNFLKI